MTPVLRLPPHGSDPADEVVEVLVRKLKAGEVVLMPTDTVYGLATAATDGGVEALARIKRRDPNKPVAVLVSTPVEGLALYDLPSSALARLAELAWPGPVTVVAAAGPNSPQALRSGGTIGVRCPEHELVRRVAECVGPLAVTSANPAGFEPLHDLADVDVLARSWPELRSVACVVDAGPLPGEASTVVEVVVEPSEEGVRSTLEATTGTLRLLRAGPIGFDRVSAWWNSSADRHT